MPASAILQVPIPRYDKTAHAGKGDRAPQVRPAQGTSQVAPRCGLRRNLLCFSTTLWDVHCITWNSGLGGDTCSAAAAHMQGFSVF